MGAVLSGFGDQVTILCVPHPLTGASILSHRSQMASGMDPLLPSPQITGCGDMKWGCFCLCGLQGGGHAWTGCLGLGRGSLGWPCLLSTPHPAVSRRMAQGLETASAHVLLCTRVCVHTCVWGLCTGGREQVCEVHMHVERHQRGPLAASPARCAANPCRIQLSIRNKSFYCWQCGSTPVSAWFGVVGSQPMGCGGPQGGGFAPTPSPLPCPG